MSPNFPQKPSDAANTATQMASLLDDTGTAGGIVLVKAWPNPFHLKTSLRFDLEWDQPVKVRILTVSGRSVRTLVAGYRISGQHHVVWDGRDNAGLQVAAGVYYAVVRGDEDTRTLKLTLLP